ncbi:MAG TPA: hypothetical protein VH639_24220 [Bryobacteraceae bacterium]|jgi:hypothetical protein
MQTSVRALRATGDAHAGCTSQRPNAYDDDWVRRGSIVGIVNIIYRMGALHSSKDMTSSGGGANAARFV